MKPPRMGKKYKVSFHRLGKWIPQPGVAKCVSYFKMYVSYHHETVIEEVPVFVYNGAFLLASDCQYKRV